MHRLVKADAIAAFVARKAVKETSVQINGEAGVSTAAVRVRNDWALRVKVYAGESGVCAVVTVEGAIINALLDFITQ